MSWKIRLDDDYGITSDSRQFTLCRIGNSINKETGKTEEKWVGKRFGSLSTIIKCYRNENIRNENVTNFKEVVKLLEEQDKKIDKITEDLGL